MRILLIVAVIFVILLVLFLLRVRAPTEVQKLTTEVADLIQGEKFAEALPIAESAVDAAKKELDEWSHTFGSHHSNVLATGQLASCLNLLAKIQSRLEKQTEAEKNLLRAISVLENAVTENHPPEGSEEPPLPHLDLPEVLGELGVFYWARERFEDSVSLNRRAIEVAGKLYEEDNPVFLISLVNLSAPLNELGRFEEAEAALLRAIKLAEPFSSEQEAIAYGHYLALSNLAQTYKGQGRLDESEATQQRAQEIAIRDLGQDCPTVDVIFH